MKPRKSNITFSDDAALEYIMALENPHKVGWDSKNRVWRTPKEKGYDKNQIAYGLDIRQDHNPVVYNFLKEKGRLKDPWLTDAEARNLMLLSYSTKGSSVEKAIEKAGGKISQRGYNVLRGMAWHGHPMKQLLNPDSVTGKAFLRAIANGDQDLNSVFDTYYGYGSNATQFADRIKADAKLRGSIVMETLGDGNKRMTFKPIPQWLPKPLPKPIPETQYPLSGSQAPESLSSWNAALSPSATPTIPSIQKLNNEQLKAVQGAFLLPEVTVLGNRRTSLLPKMPSLNDALMAYSPLNQMNRAVSDMLGLNDLWEDFDVTSDLFKAKNGKLPKYNTGLVPGLTEERSDNTRVVRPEIHLPVKRQLLKKLVTVELMLLATRNKPVLSQDAESRHGAPKAETFIGEMARVAGKDFVKADRASVAASMANPIANAALGSMDLGMNLNRSLHENTIDQNANTTLSALAILPFVRNGLKMAKAKDWVGKFRDWYENAITTANNPNEVNRALLMSRYWNAADDAHVPQIVLGSTVDDNPFKSPIDKSSLLLFNDMKRLLIREALSQTGNGVSSGIDIAKDPYSLRNLSRDVIHHEGMPDEVEDIFRHQILPRTNINPLNYDSTIDVLKRYGYNTLDDYNWNKYVDTNIAGYLDNNTLAIAMPDGYVRKAAPHEFRHRMQHLIEDKPSLSIDRKAYLNRAYDDDFVNLPNTVDEGDHLRGYLHMEKEKATTNLDARRYAFENFTDNPDIGKLPVKEQNAFLDSLSDDLIIEAVKESNGYGKRYIKFLDDKYHIYNDLKARAKYALRFRNAMKYYGMAAIPTVMAASTTIKPKQNK